MFIKRFISLFIITLLMAFSALAQTPTETEAKSPKALEEEAQKKVHAQALELLAAVSKDTERLTLAENRIYVSVTTAYLLWPHDEEGARALFKNAMADLRAILSSPIDEDAPRAYRQKMERGQMRQRLLFMLAARDGRLARSFMNETRPSESLKSDYGPVMDENELELSLASIIAAHDPQQAVEMAQKSLARGFSSNLPSLVTEIQKKDAEAAAKLTGDIVSKLKTATLSSNQEGLGVAVRLLSLAHEALQVREKKKEAKPAEPLLTEQSMRELAELIASATVNGSEEFVGRYIDIRSMMPLLEKYAPTRAAALKRKYGEQTGKIEEPGEWREYHELSESGTPEQLLAAAEKADASMSEAYYRQAAFKLANEGDGERARQVINQHIKEPHQRQQMLSEVDKQMLAGAAEKGKLAETRQLLSLARTNEERIMVLSQLAMTMSQKDKKTALQLLEEARNLSAPRAKYSRQMLAQLQLARAYATVDAAQSFAILEPTIDQLNELISSAIMLGEFFGEEEVVKDDELLVQPFVQMVEMFEQQYGKDLARLARADFERTRDAAERFQRQEVRIFARLLVAQSVLSKTDEAPPAQDDKPAVPPLATNK